MGVTTSWGRLGFRGQGAPVLLVRNQKVLLVGAVLGSSWDLVGRMGGVLLLLGCGYKVIRFLPPLDVRKREIDLALDILEDVFKKD